MAELLIIGGVQMETLAMVDEMIRFQDWCNAVRNATAGWKSPPADDHLEWLWEALTTEPGILRELGGHILFREEEWKAKPAVTVLNAGQNLGVFLKDLATFGAPVLSVPANAQPDGTITLLGPLAMGPGKAGRFECRDVKATVEIPVQQAGSLDQEAVLMKVGRLDVAVRRNMVMAWVGSLNHALTVTSRRLQPHRRSHGGRIYDHIALHKNDQWIPLEYIRRHVEAGKWKLQ